MADFLDTLKGLNVSPNLLHRVVVAEEANARQGTQSAKTRSEVRGGGKKPYKQKKTGNARQGTIRAPHYAHGGMALAVKPRDYTKKVNRKERRLALLGALADKASSGDLVVVDKIAFASPKTKDAAALIAKSGLAGAKRILVVLADHDEATIKSFQNIEGVEVRTAPRKDGRGAAFSTRDLLVAHKVLMAKDALATVEATYSASESEAPAPKKAAPKTAKKTAKEDKA
ncbi:MAG: 50S ribosomal protein L4 [Armatimonadetes bacterium]|nr:50S ribosomal protein L4 [Armatimonadota bacterium]